FSRPLRGGPMVPGQIQHMDMVFTFLKNKKETDGASPPELNHWVDFFTRDKHAAACEFWYEIHKGIHEMLREYPV
ncbi:MAG: hypothetical protein P8X90_16850, partial [Desulfobacterales bacterium]